jgi:hypothetical protein
MQTIENKPDYLKKRRNSYRKYLALEIINTSLPNLAGTEIYCRVYDAFSYIQVDCVEQMWEGFTV